MENYIVHVTLALKFWQAGMCPPHTSTEKLQATCIMHVLLMVWKLPKGAPKVLIGWTATAEPHKNCANMGPS